MTAVRLRVQANVAISHMLRKKIKLTYWKATTMWIMKSLF